MGVVYELDVIGPIRVAAESVLIMADARLVLVAVEVEVDAGVAVVEVVVAVVVDVSGGNSSYFVRLAAGPVLSDASSEASGGSSANVRLIPPFLLRASVIISLRGPDVMCLSRPVKVAFNV